MWMDQADLLDGMDFMFVQEFMSVAMERRCNAGEILFGEGDPADHFFTLMEGSVKVFVGEKKREVYRITHPGEVFGWSSLLDRNYYSASAECIEPTRVQQIERESFDRLLRNHPEKTGILYKRIAGMMGHRLVECYHQIQV